MPLGHTEYARFMSLYVIPGICNAVMACDYDLFPVDNSSYFRQVIQNSCFDAKLLGTGNAYSPAVKGVWCQ